MTTALALTFPEPDRRLEAAGDSLARRAQRANRAAQDTISDRHKLERQATLQLLKRLQTLKGALQARLMGSITDFRQFTVQALLADVDRLIAEAQADLARLAKTTYDTAHDLGDQAATDPMRAAQLTVAAGLPGADSGLVDAAFGNTVDLLTPPMQQFATNVKQAIRGVGLAGDNRMDAIRKLQDQISGAGFNAAQYRAERIIRTELSRVFNEANYAKMVALGEQFPFLKKGWRATKDNRTRRGHVEAGQKYVRGGGSIPVAQSFSVNSYDERPGKPAKLLGVVLLRFPVDPQAVPAGKLAAAATIMCRCNAFVDFDMAAFADFTAAKVSAAIPTPPAVPPARLPKPAPVPRLPKARIPKQPKPKVPKAPIPKKSDVTPAKKSKAAPAGPKVSASMVGLLEAKWKKIRDAVALIDQVHGDGTLAGIPVVSKARKTRGILAAYAHTGGRQEFLFFSSATGRKAPFNTAIHEVGHWLDHQVFGRSATYGGTTPRGMFASEDATNTLLAAYKKAVTNSRAIQTLKTWLDSYPKAGQPGVGSQGDGVIPRGIHGQHIRYLLRNREVFARAYAQWVVLRSGNAAALAELRLMQSAATTGPVAATTKYNVNGRGQAMAPDSWDYPLVWQDDDFAEIAEAFDEIMEKIGWRTRTTGGQ